MRYIVWEDDGVVKVTQPVNGNQTIEDIASSVCGNKPYILVDKVDIPDGYFRDAFEISSNSCSINMEKARVIKQEKINKEIEKSIDKLIKEELKADDLGDNAAKQKAKDDRKALRELVVDLNQFQTPEELKAYWPEELS